MDPPDESLARAGHTARLVHELSEFAMEVLCARRARRRKSPVDPILGPFECFSERRIFLADEGLFETGREIVGDDVRDRESPVDACSEKGVRAQSVRPMIGGVRLAGNEETGNG